MCWFLFIIHVRDIDAGLRVLGGRDALQDEFPFIVSLEELNEPNSENKDTYVFCTGAAIASTWILTAAHCNTGYHDPDLKQFARCNSYFPKVQGKLVALLEFYVHSAYSIAEIGLYHSEKLTVASYAKVSAVDYKSFVGREAVILGFGVTNASTFVKPVQVLTGMFKKCTSAYEKFKNSLCVVPSCSLDGTICAGDSGGPALLSSNIVGVNSLTYNDCSVDNPFVAEPGFSASVVAMVSPFVNWIQKQISNK